jgi:hypothetical protein
MFTDYFRIKVIINSFIICYIFWNVMCVITYCIVIHAYTCCYRPWKLYTFIIVRREVFNVLYAFIKFWRFSDVKMRACWDIAPWSLVFIDRYFRGAYCLHHQSDEWPWSTSPWRRRLYTPLKRRSTPTKLDGAISQKALIYILAPVRTEIKKTC